MKKFIALSLLAPFAAFAAEASDLGDIIKRAGDLLNQIAPLLLALAFVYLLWNIVKYIEAGQGDAKGRETARDAIIASLILLFVMVSIWGLVGIIRRTVGVGEGATAPTLTPPSVPESSL